jgi:hypothetical protein
MPQVPLRFTWGYSWCHASGVGCLRRNCVKPTLSRKNFGRAGSSSKAATLQNFPSFPCFPWTKNRLRTISPRQGFSCFSLLRKFATFISHRFSTRRSCLGVPGHRIRRYVLAMRRIFRVFRLSCGTSCYVFRVAGCGGRMRCGHRGTRRMH